jgi:serpin B
MKKTILLSALLAFTAQADDFAFKLYDQLKTTEGNLFFSPASIETALAMTREGAAGNTLRQMMLLLGGEPAPFPKPAAVTLDTANALWTDQTFPVLEAFQQTVQEKYSAEIRSADFRGQPDAEREMINRWVEEKTRDKIKDLLAPDTVDDLTRLILVNAIYFKGDWLHAFDKQKTADEPFWTAAEESVDVPMMTMKPGRFGYMESDGFQALELPYQGDELAMLIILPKDRCGLARVEDGLSADALSEWTAALRKEEVEVHLPRFKTESQFNLNQMLSGLGMSDAFNPALADFSGMTGTNDLFISAVVHKAFVQVNEEGTEAAAATGVTVGITSIPAPPEIFRADRPFLFLIRANESGTILFMGRVCDPSK